MPDDLKANWINMARKAQSVCGVHQQYFVVVELKVLVAPGGDPVFWFEPSIHRIEPMRNANVFLHQVMEKMLE